MTKIQFAKSIVSSFRINNEITNDVPDIDLESYVFQSSALGVALEFLGLIINEDIQEYVSTRAGCLYSYADTPEGSSEPEIAFLTVRDILQLLPD